MCDGGGEWERGAEFSNLFCFCSSCMSLHNSSYHVNRGRLNMHRSLSKHYYRNLGNGYVQCSAFRLFTFKCFGGKCVHM